MFTPIQDIKIETIDFKWIKETTKISHLKRAIKLIQLDGNYFTDLKQACYQRIGQLDPLQKYTNNTCRKIVIDNRATIEDKQLIEKQLQQWENSLKQSKAENNHQIFQKQNQSLQQLDPQIYFNKDPAKQTNNKKLAQNEKNKGNQAIKSKDFNEAIKYYTNSINYDKSLYQSYGNRALAYIKIKQFQKALDDCQSAIIAFPHYTKAHHRKAKALIGLKNKVDAYKALQEALKIEPENTECLTELRDLREQLSQQEKNKLEGSSKFKKIAIEEDSDQQQVNKLDELN